MKYASKLAVLLFGVGFLLMCHGAYCVSPLSLLKAALICLVPFILVTVLRRLINAPRPYEVYDFYTTPPKDKKGRSFPSRHVYSASVIATLTCFLYPVLGTVLCVLALTLAVLRVLLGIHFLRDVITGALVGVFAALLGVLILLPF